MRDGILLKWRIVNFMAHERWEETARPGVTFITGPNGAGKSAMQIALKLLLGDKAANTLRTSSIKELIKKGCSFGEVEATFTNYYGTLSKTKYGSLIKLKRRIKPNGSSLYQISCPDGRWRQIKQNEMTIVLHALNIDPNNPFQFLQQLRSKDNSKGGSSQQANKDFNKFCEATQLTDINEMLETSKDNLKAAKNYVNDKKELLQFYTIQERQLKMCLDNILRMEMGRNKLQELTVEYSWANVQVKEMEQAQIQRKKAEVLKETEDLKIEKKSLAEKITEVTSKEE